MANVRVVAIDVVLHDLGDEWEPQQHEVVDYAKWLGMEEEDTDLHWIALNGLKAPLPPGWKPCRTDADEIFYFNFETNESMWDHPSDQHSRALFQRVKAKRDAPNMLVSLSAEKVSESLIKVRCESTMTGNLVMCSNLKATERIRCLRWMLSAHIGKQGDEGDEQGRKVSTSKIRFLLPDGTLLEKNADGKSIASVLGMSDCEPVQSEVEAAM